MWRCGNMVFKRVASEDFVFLPQSKHSLPIAPNLLDRNFRIGRPNRVWIGDVIYIATEEGWLYLAVVLDLFSRRIVGWSMRRDMTSAIVRDALEMACLQRRPQAGTATFHSDRGSQYASEHYLSVVKLNGLTPSMSRKGNCWGNACSETLFASLKVERLHGERFMTARATKDAVMNWILWYKWSGCIRRSATKVRLSSNRHGCKYSSKQPEKQVVVIWKSLRDSYTPTTSTTTGLSPQPQRIWGTHSEGKVIEGFPNFVATC